MIKRYDIHRAGGVTTAMAAMNHRAGNVQTRLVRPGQLLDRSLPHSRTE